MIRRKEFDKDLEELRNLLEQMGEHVTDALDGAVLALQTLDTVRAQEIVKNDLRLNAMEDRIMEIGSRLIITQQPVAKDLRRIIVAFKISSDLERMGDLALDVAKVTMRIQGQQLIKPLVDIPRMAELVTVMTTEAIQSYLDENTDLAYKMAQDDDQVDGLYSSMINELYAYMVEKPEAVNQAMLLTLVGRYIERIADHATNIGESVVYLQTNAVYGFTTMLLRLIEEHKPTHMIVAFDAGKITFRHEGYEDYKGGRQKTPPELSEQFPLLKELLQGLGVPQFEIGGYEADDIIGTISREADAAGRQVMIVSGDKDMLQLASEHTTVALVRKGVTEVELYGPQQIRDKYDLTPEQIIDLKGLMGDASDNIPGVPGVGEKTALKLLQQFGSVEGVLAGTDELKGKMKEKLEEHADSAIMSKKLATIYREVPLAHAWEDMVFSGIKADTAGPALAKLEFKSLLERLSLSAYTPAADGSSSDPAAVEAAALDITIVDEAGLQALIAALPDISALHVESNGENPHRAE
ncbi:hypothetical protein KC345_g10879, partial [Hortaea werneckii]